MAMDKEWDKGSSAPQGGRAGQLNSGGPDGAAESGCLTVSAGNAVQGGNAGQCGNAGRGGNIGSGGRGNKKTVLLLPLWIIALCLLFLAGMQVAERYAPTPAGTEGTVGEKEAGDGTPPTAGEGKGTDSGAGMAPDQTALPQSTPSGGSSDAPAGTDNGDGSAPFSTPGKTAPEDPATDWKLQGAVVRDSTEAPISPLPSCFVTEFDTEPLILPVTPTLGTNDREIRGVWVATVYGLNFPSRPGADRATLEKELDGLVETAVASGMNSLFFQVRPRSDALYASSLFPTSRYLVGTEGAPLPMDPLEYLIRKAHRAGVTVHAWINPYRVTTGGEGVGSLSEGNPARLHPEWLISVGGNLYYNPALPQVRALVVEGIGELLDRYALDGVVFDDYFYPPGITTEDKKEYEDYLSQGGGLSLGDWRREQVNRLVESASAAIRKKAPACRFGISPRGIWRNASQDPAGSDTRGSGAYDSIYCDALTWAKKGWVDYLSPQLYWSFQNEAAPFDRLADWWQKALVGTGVSFCPSLAAYSLPPDEIEAQIAYLTSLASYRGYVLYNITSLS